MLYHTALMRLNGQARLRRNEMVSELAAKEAAISHLTQQLKQSSGSFSSLRAAASSRLGSFFNE